MSQIALPFSPGALPERIIVGASNRPVIDALGRAADWPFRTAILVGPPRSGKSLLARWFAARGAGEALDDADTLPEDDVFHRWNRAQASGVPLLLVSGLPPGTWRVALPDLASRLGAALLLRIEPPDDALLAELVDDHARRRGLTLGEGAAAWLLARLERSHAAAEALVSAADRLSLERKRPLTLALVREALAASGGEGPPRRP